MAFCDRLAVSSCEAVPSTAPWSRWSNDLFKGVWNISALPPPPDDNYSWLRHIRAPPQSLLRTSLVWCWDSGLRAPTESGPDGERRWVCRVRPLSGVSPHGRLCCSGSTRNRSAANAPGVEVATPQPGGFPWGCSRTTRTPPANPEGFSLQNISATMLRPVERALAATLFSGTPPGQNSPSAIMEAVQCARPICLHVKPRSASGIRPVLRQELQG